MKVKFKRVSPNACLPTKSTGDSACFDSYSAKDVSLRPGETKTVKLDLGSQFSKNYVCRIYPRPALSFKPLFLGGGVIDSDYRVNTYVILTNLLSWTVDINRGVRIAPIMLLKKEEVDFEEVDKLEIEIEIRGRKNFGSTGLQSVLVSSS